MKMKYILSCSIHLYTLRNLPTASKSKNSYFPRTCTQEKKQSGILTYFLSYFIYHLIIPCLAIGGVKRMSNLIYDETREVLRMYVQKIVKDATMYASHCKKLLKNTKECYWEFRKFSFIYCRLPLNLFC